MTRAANNPSVFTITEKALLGLFLFETTTSLLRHNAKWALTHVDVKLGQAKVIRDRRVGKA